jgi:hypothetical protein
MENLAPPGEPWGRHLSYKAATSYYDYDQVRWSNEGHVDRCDYCKSLLDSLHSTSVDAISFAREAGAALLEIKAAASCEGGALCLGWECDSVRLGRVDVCFGPATARDEFTAL